MGCPAGSPLTGDGRPGLSAPLPPRSLTVFPGSFPSKPRKICSGRPNLLGNPRLRLAWERAPRCCTKPFPALLPQVEFAPFLYFLIDGFQDGEEGMHKREDGRRPCNTDAAGACRPIPFARFMSAAAAQPRPATFLADSVSPVVQARALHQLHTRWCSQILLPLHSLDIPHLLELASG